MFIGNDPRSELEIVKDYYGKTLKSNLDLQTNACTVSQSPPKYLKEILQNIHEEVKEKFYGCGSPIPYDLEGKTVLDLGSGSGRDCFVLSKLVGATGKVIGIDMTKEQIEVANKYKEYHSKLFGYSELNIKFINGFIEDLRSCQVGDSSIDIVISNCVINLSPSKEKVFSEIFRVLKPGGELFFSDIFSNRRLPREISEDSVLLGECLGGAMYTEDFRRLLNQIGCSDFRVLSKSRILVQNPELEEKIGKNEFYAMTIRAFKLDLEDRCEDYGQTAKYLGTIEHCPNVFELDDHHAFEKGKWTSVCGNTAMMLEETRYSKHFEVLGERKEHFGLFDCTDTGSANTEKTISGCC
ncbi:methyltransferase type 11 [Leptospira perolatii]|uniref:Arsenite methyltransferase n=1 Tax=Leptospira perolatii TaxID=2023191 RepID=A0A2M9ZKE8_9LEPT|nr:methyltransferase domain-containing protein [Leptospira perolatii]PJZ69410.1 methyltransferase type 11 [Leptospira perolatii]PJZ72545.1 methyltransferase type 11 [Leptospira perolatii]